MSTQPAAPVRTRFAPSPTGLLHVGNVRTAVFAWLLARHHGGQFLLRIEDTDRARLVPESLAVLFDTLGWLGIDVDEGPQVGGPHGPYVQSERKAIYAGYAEKLLAEGTAYRCYCSEERLGELRLQQQREGRPTGYDRRCRLLSPEERAAHEAAGDPFVVRFAVPPEGTTYLHDELRGAIAYENAKVQDHVILKTDGFPVYHFAVVIDDHLMRISHVIRGEEYLSSGALDTLLHQALGLEQPKYVHGSTVLTPDRRKLGKRHGAQAVLEYREMGFVPEAMFNYVALLGAGYSADREIYSRDELITLFDVDRMNPSPAIFDRDKLEWMNGQYINHHLPLPDVAARGRPFLERAGLVTPDFPAAELERVVAVVKDRMRLLTEVVELTEFFFRDPVPSAAELAGKKLTPPDARRAIAAACDRLAAMEPWEDAELERELRAAGEELGIKTGPFFMALRVAVTGKTATPPLTATMEVLGRERTLARLERAVVTLDSAIS